MCGIAGIITETPLPNHLPLLKRMADALAHRGPAGEGFWVHDQQQVGFAHRRLAILDLSAAAAQPLHYLHYTIVFNGEIYNYKELKETLGQKGYHFFNSGDTEVIPAAFDYWGLDFLHQLDGMFAFALYDHKTGQTILARDRFGEKPLYYATHPIDGIKSLLFASEMKALWTAGVPSPVNHSMLLNYLTVGYVQNPVNKSATFYENIYSLPPAHYLLLTPANEDKTPVRWYDPKIGIAAQPGGKMNDEDAIAAFDRLFSTSIQRRLRSDVPVGTSLSGGLDSSAVVAYIRQYLQTHRRGNVTSKAFSAVFPGFRQDEYRYSKTVSDAFSMEQYCTTPTADDLATHWNTMMWHQEEPVQSSSAFTQFKVYKTAAEFGVTVLLDGQGADEILAGYKKYIHWYLQQLFPGHYKTFRYEKELLEKHRLLQSWDYRNIAAAMLPAYAANKLQERAIIQQQNTFLEKDYLDAYSDHSTLEKPVVKHLEDVLYYNTFQFGLEELLRYADRNSMAHSREVRLPFLFHELVEFIFSLPARFKIRDGFTKWILRKSVDSKLSGEITWRTDKIGFEPPQKDWMVQKNLEPLIMESRQKLVAEGIASKTILDTPAIAKDAHEPGNSDWNIMNAAWLLNQSAQR